MFGPEQRIPTGTEKDLLEQSKGKALAFYLRLAKWAAIQTGKPIHEIIETDLARLLHAINSEPVAVNYTFPTPYGDLVYFPKRRQAISPLLPNGTFVGLSPNECLLLETLISNPHAQHTHWELHLLLQRKFNETPRPITSNRVDAALCRLRGKLGDNNIGKKGAGHKFRLIHSANTTRFPGYSLTPHP